MTTAKWVFYSLLALLLAAVVLGATFSQEAKASVWTALSGMFADTVESKMFAVEAQGLNIRAYVYQVEPLGKTCIFNATSGGSGGLSCFDTPK